MEKLARAGIDVKYTYATAHTKARKTAAVVAVFVSRALYEALARAPRLARRSWWDAVQ